MVRVLVADIHLADTAPSVVERERQQVVHIWGAGGILTLEEPLTRYLFSAVHCTVLYSDVLCCTVQRVEFSSS